MPAIAFMSFAPSACLARETRDNSVFDSMSNLDVLFTPDSESVLEVVVPLCRLVILFGIIVLLSVNDFCKDKEIVLKFQTF